jgi:probable rRNA maturation factor
MSEVINCQRKIKIAAEDFQLFTERAIEIVPEAKGNSATIAFISDWKMRELNKTFRGKNSTTDVLSFPFESNEFEACENNLGDIVISVEQAERQAKENNLDLATEVKQLILHGVLHLCGFDHETDNGKMNEIELKLREKLNI